MTQHTPGPWTTDGRVLRNAAGNSIASSGNNRVVTGDELDASMILAAAAPDLLAALDNLTRCIERDNLHTTHGVKVADARAAIARARGTL